MHLQAGARGQRAGDALDLPASAVADDDARQAVRRACGAVDRRRPVPTVDEHPDLRAGGIGVADCGARVVGLQDVCRGLAGVRSAARAPLRHAHAVAPSGAFEPNGGLGMKGDGDGADRGRASWRSRQQHRGHGNQARKGLCQPARPAPAEDGGVSSHRAPSVRPAGLDLSHISKRVAVVNRDARWTGGCVGGPYTARVASRSGKHS